MTVYYASTHPLWNYNYYVYLDMEQATPDQLEM